MRITFVSMLTSAGRSHNQASSTEVNYTAPRKHLNTSCWPSENISHHSHMSCVCVDFNNYVCVIKYRLISSFTTGRWSEYVNHVKRLLPDWSYRLTKSTAHGKINERKWMNDGFKSERSLWHGDARSGDTGELAPMLKYRAVDATDRMAIFFHVSRILSWWVVGSVKVEFRSQN